MNGASCNNLATLPLKNRPIREEYENREMAVHLKSQGIAEIPV
jgi:hypothetical protein